MGLFALLVLLPVEVWGFAAVELLVLFELLAVVV